MNPTGSTVRSSPREALFSSPLRIRALRKCSSAFADTLNWEAFYRDDWRQAHLGRQAEYARVEGEGMPRRRPRAETEDLLELDMGGAGPRVAAGEARQAEEPLVGLALDLGAGAVSPAAVAHEPTDDVVFDMEPFLPPPAPLEDGWDGDEHDGEEHVKVEADARPGPDVVSLVLGEDLTERLMEAAKDELTGLFGQKMWLKALDGISGERCAVAFIDVDGLKRVNDGPSGNEAGDTLIATVGRAVGSVTRRSDLACPCGGDEFGVILRGAGVDG